MVVATAGNDRLSETFSYAEARRLGLAQSRLRRMLEDGTVERLSRGLYRRADADPLVDLDLVEIHQRVPQGTLCLTSALARHGLTDQIPPTIDVAVPRGRREPIVTAPVTWHQFSPATFHVGRELLSLGTSERIGIYNAERSIIDSFRLRHREGSDVAIEALRAWLRRPGSSPAALMTMAKHFPQTLTPLRTTLEILL